MQRVLAATFVAALAIAAAGTAALAADAPVVDRRQEIQQGRIGRGIESGQLTPREAARLEREQAKIAAEEKAFKADGELSKKERAKLRRDQNRPSRRIYREQHDAQHRQSGLFANVFANNPGISNDQLPMTNEGEAWRDRN